MDPPTTILRFCHCTYGNITYITYIYDLSRICTSLCVLSVIAVPYSANTYVIPQLLLLLAMPSQGNIIRPPGKHPARQLRHQQMHVRSVVSHEHLINVLHYFCRGQMSISSIVFHKNCSGITKLLFGNMWRFLRTILHARCQDWNNQDTTRPFSVFDLSLGNVKIGPHRHLLVETRQRNGHSVLHIHCVCRCC